MFRSGAFVAEHVEPVDEEQIQPNGVDLRLKWVLEQREPGYLTRDGTNVGNRQTVHPEEREFSPPGSADGVEESSTAESWGDGRETYYLTPGGYIVQYAETVSIPEGHIGFILPRSSLMRNSCMLNTAVWDAGYTGRGEGLLQVHQDIELERDVRIAQLVLAEADHEGLYDGSYQEERLH